MSAAIWNYPTRIRFGIGELNGVADEAKRVGARRVLVVTDQGVRAAGLFERVLAPLTEAGLQIAVFDGVRPNPTEQDAEQGAEVYRQGDCDVIVALGGGSPLDAAKLIGVRVRTNVPFEKLDDSLGGDALIPVDLPPVIAIPTTAGTGSEVGRAAVVVAAGTGRKTVIFHPSMLPRVAILDPELTVGLPAPVTAATGFDAFTHCLEAYVATGDHPMADAIALAGMQLVVRSLRVAVETGSDLQARGDMLKAAMMGAVAFQKGLGACHSMAHPLSSEKGVHHGLANALCLPTVVEFNLTACREKYGAVAALMGVKGAAQLPGAIRRFREQLGLANGLASVGVGGPDVARLAELALLDGCHQQNPRLCSQDDFEQLFRSAI